jgi:N-acetylglutamate synthase-like GNAT family acetyltransferase
MAHFTIRDSTPRDWEPAKDLLLRCALPVDGAKEHFANFVLAFDAARLVACGGLEYYGETALLRSVAVESSHRGRGLGKSLVTGFLAAAAKRQIGRSAALSFSRRPPVIFFLEWDSTLCRDRHCRQR